MAGFRAAARRFLTAGVPVAAICGATYGLALEGLLDDRAHTSNAAEYLAYSGYAGRRPVRRRARGDRRQRDHRRRNDAGALRVARS